MPVGFLFLYALLCTVEPRFNEPRHNEVLDITEDFVAQIKMKQNLHLTKPGESEQISSVPRSFVKSGSHFMWEISRSSQTHLHYLDKLSCFIFYKQYD